MEETRKVEGITLSEQELDDIQRVCKQGIISTAQQEMIDYDYIMRLSDLYRRVEKFRWIMDRES